MSFLVGIFARKAVQNVALKSTEKVVSKTSFANVASVAGKVGTAAAVGGIAYYGINSLANVATSSLGNVSSALTNSVPTGLGDTLSTLGDSVSSGIDSIFLLGGAGLVLLFLVMARKK